MQVEGKVYTSGTQCIYKWKLMYIQVKVSYIQVVAKVYTSGS
jgi:hypothetical protein